MGEWMYSSTFSWPRHWLEVSGQLHALAALPRGKNSGTHLTGGRVDPWAGLDDVQKRKFLTLPGLEPPTPRLYLFILLFGLRGYWHCGHSLPIVPASGDSEDDCGEADGIKIGRGNRSSRRKPAPAPLLSITKSNMTTPGFEPGPPRWEAGD
jgi:hypothetical protein